MRYIIADIHGYSRTFKNILNKIGLNKNDVLYLLGDYIDRGPDSKGVFDKILKLIEDGFDIRPITGNHEEMALEALYPFPNHWDDGGENNCLDQWLQNGAFMTLKSFNAIHPWQIPDKYWKFINDLPLIVIEQDFVLAHAALDFTKDDPLNKSDPSYVLWERKIGAVREKIGGRVLITGHNITPLDNIKKAVAEDADHVVLDNGVHTAEKGIYGCGDLVALNWDTRELIVAPCSG